MPYALQAVKNMSEQSQVEQLSQTDCPIHPSDPCSPRPDEAGKYPAWQIWILLILTYVLEMTTAILREPRAFCNTLNTVQYHLLIKPLTWPDYFFTRFFSVMRSQTLAPCLHCDVITVALLSHMDHQDKPSPQTHPGGVQSNQLFLFESLSLPGTQFDTWVIEVPGQVIIL